MPDNKDLTAQGRASVSGQGETTEERIRRIQAEAAQGKGNIQPSAQGTGNAGANIPNSTAGAGVATTANSPNPGQNNPEQRVVSNDRENAASATGTDSQARDRFLEGNINSQSGNTQDQNKNQKLDINDPNYREEQANKANESSSGPEPGEDTGNEVQYQGENQSSEARMTTPAASAQDVTVKTSDPEKTEKEAALEEAQKILKEYGGMASNIPLTSPYWALMNKHRAVKY